MIPITIVKKVATKKLAEKATEKKTKKTATKKSTKKKPPITNVPTMRSRRSK